MKRSGHICTIESSDLLERRKDCEIRRCREGTCGDVFKVVDGQRQDLTEDEFELAVVRA